MKVYVAHSKELNYIDDLYLPIREDESLKQYNILLPHEDNSASYNSREFYKELSVIIAEVSFPATGLGIELGWAYDDEVPIYCIYQKDKKISSSLKCLTSNFIEYKTTEELLNIIKKIIMEVQENNN